MIHELKILDTYFEPALELKKTFEVRKNDRDFRVGDLLALNETDSVTREYTGRSLLFKVTYILDDPEFVKDGFIVMGISPRRVSNEIYTSPILNYSKAYLATGPYSSSGE